MKKIRERNALKIKVEADHCTFLAECVCLLECVEGLQQYSMCVCNENMDLEKGSLLGGLHVSDVACHFWSTWSWTLWPPLV